MRFLRNLLPKTLLIRFMLIITIPTIIGQLLAVFLFYDRHWYNVSYYTSRIIANEVLALLEEHQKKPTELEEDGIIDHSISKDYINLSYKFIPRASLNKKQYRLNDELQIFKNILDGYIKNKKILRLNEKGRIEILIQLKDGIMQIDFSSKLLMNPTTYIFVLWLLFLTFVLLSVSLVFSKNQIKSILDLTAAADSFGRKKQIITQYKPSGAKEIRRAGIAFLKMKERIENQVAKRTQMLAMISHDLRTPLTRMKLQLELMDESEEIIELKDDIDTMTQMINSYLDFARGESAEEFIDIDLSNWLKELIQTKWSQLNIVLNLIPSIKAKLQPSSFQRVIANIIENATKYADMIRVSLYISGSMQIILDIEDNGSGISDEEKELVFKPFYRSDKSRHINTSSVGLGLAITKEIVTKHSGTITLHNSHNLGGLLVRITLPLVM